MKLKLPLLFILFVSFLTFGQQKLVSDNTEISVLTFGPGNSLNDAFGHNAFRVNDKSLGIDIVYGYGEYDFDAPNFYLKFAQGKLNYLISRHKFSDIYYHYSSYNRSISEQVLNLTTEEKQKLFSFLEHNYKPKNRRYLYDFFYNNCATKIRDITQISTSSKISYNTPNDFEVRTFRNLIHEHVNQNSWGSLGIDIALGSIIDTDVKSYEYMFLPKYINSFFASAKIGKEKNLVKQSSILYKKKPENAKLDFILSPLVVFSLITVLILFITYKDYGNGRRSRWLDIILFGLTGIIGLLLLLLWFATDHTTTGYNYNLLWAFPLNLIVINQLSKKKVKNWVKGYLKFLIILLCLMTLHWLIGVQNFAIGLIPLLIAFFLRYIFILRHFSKN
ncbi:DUF4105 domain-containing protein [Winogradskyella sp. PE311]|uniref:Lnb N-terminal periplasmic domain-containing protein n=1 Tax=Winogradskyella sp. PE311 TaxID=3366943 RepID=UPI00397F4985